MDGAVDHLGVLLFERFACAGGDLTAQGGGVGGERVRGVGTCPAAFEGGGCGCARVRGCGERGWFMRDFGEDVQGLGRLVRVLFIMYVRTCVVVWQKKGRTSGLRAIDTRASSWIMGYDCPLSRAAFNSATGRSYAIIFACVAALNGPVLFPSPTPPATAPLALVATALEPLVLARIPPNSSNTRALRAAQSFAARFSS